ncbi:MAG TPA: phosphoribosyltransferase family protein [Acidimicrobiales bacterium]|nr:phosphoribosyltransferase family protein [Acidimicrobiales bacterium]
MSRAYRDRAQAGEELAGLLNAYAGRADWLVLALPRGGVAVAAPIARTLGLPLDILPVRRLGVPGQEELAMGAIAAGDDGAVRVLNHDVVTNLGIDAGTVEAVTGAEQRHLEALALRLRGSRPAPVRRGRGVILVDDGLATGATMEAAIVSCRQAGVTKIVVAVPVGAPATVTQLAGVADTVVCPLRPSRFGAVGFAYHDFAPVQDYEAVDLLNRAWADERERRTPR